MSKPVYIDAHQHFWKFDPVRDSWINDDMAVIQRDFLPADLAPILAQHGFAGSVVVQSDQSEEENAFHLHHAAQYDLIKGIVGWVDLTSEAVEERLAYYSGYPAMKGFRHVLQGEPDRAYMLQPGFMRGIGMLNRYGFTYDILVYHDQVKYLPEFVASFPNQKLVIDHIAKPRIKDGDIGQWQKEMEAVAAYDNVYCKISGMVTEAEWKNWSWDNFTPYLDAIVQAFGTSRIMYGSDWPVCLVAASYEQMLGIVKSYFAPFSKAEQDAFFGGNAIQFYNL